MNSVIGLTSSKTMKLRGEIKGERVAVMIGLGATHNFISVDLVRKWELEVDKVVGYGVILSTRLTVKGEGIYRGVELQFPGLIVMEDFLPLELRSSDIILGLQCMETLGVTYTNWKTKVIRFKVGETRVELQGDHSLTKAQVALKTMAKSLKHGSEGVLVELNHLGTKGRPNSTEVPKNLEEMIQRFKEMFNMSKALPPIRGREHYCAQGGC